MRCGEQRVEAVGRKRGDLGERLARHQRAGEPARHRDRDLDRLRLQPAFDRLHLAGKLRQCAGDAFMGGGGAALRLGARLRLGGGEPALVAALLRRRDRGLVLLRA